MAREGKVTNHIFYRLTIMLTKGHLRLSSKIQSNDVQQRVVVLAQTIVSRNY